MLDLTKRYRFQNQDTTIEDEFNGGVYEVAPVEGALALFMQNAYWLVGTAFTDTDGQEYNDAIAYENELTLVEDE